MEEFITTARDLANGLDALVAVQRKVSAPVPGAVPEGSTFPTKDALRTYALATIVEIAEWVQTLDYKAWSNDKVLAAPRKADEIVLDEFADILAFIGILTLYMENWGMETEDIAHAYVLKSEENIRRIERNFGNG